MAILTPEHLFDQASRLIEAPSAGPPRQVDLRRAASAAYYGVFHFLQREVADAFIGVTLRTTPRYALAYRSLDHRGIRTVCEAVRKSQPAQSYAPFVPPGGFDQGIVALAVAFPSLQERRHAADYDPLTRFRTLDVQTIIETARGSVAQYWTAQLEHRRMFLTLLLCPPRA